MNQLLDALALGPADILDEANPQRANPELLRLLRVMQSPNRLDPELVRLLMGAAPVTGAMTGGALVEALNQRR